MHEKNKIDLNTPLSSVHHFKLRIRVTEKAYEIEYGEDVNHEIFDDYPHQLPLWAVHYIVVIFLVFLIFFILKIYLIFF